MVINVGLEDLILISPMLVLFCFSLVPLMFKAFSKNREPNVFFVRVITMLGLVASFLLVSAIHLGAAKQAFSGALVFDGISYWSGLLVLAITGVSLFLVFEHVATKGAQLSEQVFLILNSAVGMLIMLWANDLIVTFVGIEIMSLALYVLIALSREEKLAKEASFKYFILGSFASAVMLYGIAFIYGTAGVTYLDQLATVAPKLIAANHLFLVGFFLVTVGFCFKVSIFPFHAWTPDVYQGSPTPVTSFMATAVKLVSFVAFLRLFATKGLMGSEALVDALQWLAVLTMIVGNIAAIQQNNLKRMLAYSGIAHSGYAIVGLITAGLSSSASEGATGLIFYLFVYSIMTLGSFAVVCLFEKHGDTLISVDDLKGMASKHPAIALSLTIILLSLAGLPPTLGFFGKFYLFNAAIGEGLVWLAVWGMINSVISVYYYLRPIVLMYMYEGDGVAVSSGRHLTNIVVFSSAIIIILVGLYSGPFFSSVQTYVASAF